MSASSFRHLLALPSLVVSTLVLALSAFAAAAAEPPTGFEPAAERGPSAWLDGAWVPLAGAVAPETGAAEASTAVRAAAAAASSEGSEIRRILPLLPIDGSAQRAVFVAAVDGESCLWSSDGTAAGTFRVEPAGECVPVPPGIFSPFVGVADGVAYFVAGSAGLRYWRTDGTSAGTWPLTDFVDEGLAGRLFNLIAVPPLGIVVFTADDGVHGTEPWVSDGSPSGATLLADLSPGPDGFVPFFYRAVGSRVFFFVWRGGIEYELWVTDGTPAGTRLVETVGSEDFPVGPRSAYAAGDRLVFFLGSGHPCVVELWTSDGTAAGTQAIRSFDGTNCAISGQFQAATVDEFPGEVFFAADDGANGGELWRTDGTAAGTERLTDLAPAQPFRQHFPLNFPPVGRDGEIFFAADDGTHGMEPWKSDGTPGGAELVADLCPGGCSSAPGPLTVVGSQLAFSAETPEAGHELWVSDGTAAGTERVTDLCAGTCGAGLFAETVFAGSLLFVADDGLHGQEWWIFTPPAGPAVRLTDLEPAHPFGTFIAMAPLAGRAVFAADDGEHGREPWVTDGTPAGTHLLADLQGPVEAPAIPAAPSDLAVERLGGGQVRLTWQDNSDDEDGFFVEVERAAGGLNLHPVGPDVTSHTLQLEPGRYRLRVRAFKSLVGQSEPTNEVEVAIALTGSCSPSAADLCLGEGRFRVWVDWRNQHAAPGVPNTGQGHAVPGGDGIDDSGTFWFFTPDNLELVVKVLDGTTVNGFFWVFWGALSDVEYTITVEDTATGALRQYHNPPGRICGGSDTAAFPLAGDGGGFARTAGASQAPPTPPTPDPFAAASGPPTRFLAVDAPARTSAAAHPFIPCVPDDDTLCLLDGTLAVTVDWRDQHNGGSGVGHAVPYTDVTGFFTFFHPENVELVVKALDGRTVNGKIWVFYGALSDVEYTIRVENRADGHAVRTYENPPGTICGRGDTAAF